MNSETMNPEVKETKVENKAVVKKATKKAPAKTAAKSVKAVAKGKAAKSAKAAKGTNDSKGEKKASNRGRFSDDQKITMLIKDNPSREGTKAYDNFELYRKYKTVGSFVAAGGDRSRMGNDALKRKYIKIS